MNASQRTPLYDSCVDQQARMTPFAGWEMPVQFEGIRQEHAAVRTDAGAFDISHMGKFRLGGSDVIAQLQALVPTDLSKLRDGRAQYTVLLNEAGGIIDDLIVYHQGTDDSGSEVISLIVNAATTQKDYDWLRSHLPDTITLEDHSQSQALIAVQGPQAIAKLQPLCPDTNLFDIGRYGHGMGEVLGYPAFLARTGYTGEDGFEVMVPAEAADKVWSRLIGSGVTPCGLGARDTLRLEAAMALYGQDISDKTTPLEAGLGWLVHLEKPQDFVGRSALETQKADGVGRKLVGIALSDRNIARHDYPILHNEEVVGIVTSGTLSPTLGYPIALGYVPANLAKVGQALTVGIRKKECPATVVKRPFYKRER